MCMWVSAYPTEYRLGRYVKAAELHFGTVDSSTFGMILIDVQIWSSPERDYTSMQLPGRNGALLLGGMSLKNVDVKYTFAIPNDFQRKYWPFINEMISQSGYQRVWDSISPEVYRMGVIMTGIEPQISNRGDFGKVEIIINCKPQRYIVSGDQPIEVSSTNSYLTNQFAFASLPLIKVTGISAGTLQIGKYTVQIKTLRNKEPIYLDCETMNAYGLTGSVIKNRNCDINAPEFPRLEPGENKIHISGGITSVEITPRWWEL